MSNPAKHEEKMQDQQESQLQQQSLPQTKEKSSQIRKLIAKYDYDPVTQSPNPDANKTELAFHKDDIITVYGDTDDDGFFVGELNGIKGLVPSNFFSRIRN